jgi:hypothetical protein
MSDTREKAKRALAALVAQFGELDQKALTAEESEATARSWVEKLLAVFGWDADPRQVRQEYTIRGREVRRLRREGTTQRRPDYALKVGDERVLYIDVKRFDASIEDDENVAFQVRSYGWSAGFRVSYGCDFAELAIWDCRHKPDAMDEARVARLHYLRYPEYVEKFDLLWDYLSREAIAGGSLDRLHPADKPPRGAEPLDVAFEAKLSEWRVELAKSILRYGKTRDPEVISGASQRILDRIVFLRLCEELGLEEYGALNGMVNDCDGFWPLFVEAHEKRYRKVYDGLLFPSREEDDPTAVEAHLRQWWLKGRIFEHVVRGLYFPQPYRFDAVPLELLGGIYERFLGKRLRVVGNDVQDEFKPEYQRTKGAVYTPSWVVRRVVGRTLGPLTEDAEPEAILGLRILDPACGSASFLLGVYDHLEGAILEWARRHPKDRRRHGLVVEDQEGLRLSVPTSRRIIEGCLHGVDIDPNAVEVARMSLALRHLERAAGDLPDEPRDLLSGIGRNIRQGNSLVGPDIAGLGLDPDRVRATMPFPWKDRLFGFGDVLAGGGFHAVVGNPPYIEVKRYREWMPSPCPSWSSRCGSCEREGGSASSSRTGSSRPSTESPRAAGCGSGSSSKASTTSGTSRSFRAGPPTPPSSPSRPAPTRSSTGPSRAWLPRRRTGPPSRRASRLPSSTTAPGRSTSPTCSRSTARSRSGTGPSASTGISRSASGCRRCTGRSTSFSRWRLPRARCGA